MFHRWLFFDHFTFRDGWTLGDVLFSYEHPVLSMAMGPITLIILFVGLLWPISVVGRHGIIPAAALLVCIILMHLLYSKVSNTILYVWVQPFICYAEFIFTKYAFAANREDPGVGLIGWLMFAAVAVVIMWYTAGFLDIIDNSWGWIYLIPYGAAWVSVLISPERVYYIIAYLAVFALFMTIYIALKRRGKKDFDIEEFRIWPAIVLFLVTLFAWSHPELAQSMSPDLAQEFKTFINDPNTDDFVRFFAVIINFFITFPVTRGMGMCIDKMVSLLAQFG